MSVGKFVTGFVIGVLLAPQSGEETREQISKTTKDAMNKASYAVKEIQEKADDMVSEVQKKGEEIIDRIQGLINKQKEGQM